MAEYPDYWRAALVHARSRGRAGLLQLTQDVAEDRWPGSYGHRHPGQEEVYFVLSGIVTFKIDDDIFEAGPRTAVRVGGDAFRSVHNDTDDETELLIFSRRLDEPPTETRDDFWASA